MGSWDDVYWDAPSSRKPQIIVAVGQTINKVVERCFPQTCFDSLNKLRHLLDKFGRRVKIAQCVTMTP
jgi:hypothetical protein